MATDNLTADRVRKLLRYEPETGNFFWLQGTKFAGKPAGADCKTHGYKRITIGVNTYYAHRLAWLLVYGAWPEHSIDHIDGRPFNNAITNLRDVDCRTNCQNVSRAKSNSKSGLLGAHWSASSNAWCAQIRIGDKTVHIGTYKSAGDAHIAYVAAKRMHHSGNTL